MRVCQSGQVEIKIEYLYPIPIPNTYNLVLNVAWHCSTVVHICLHRTYIMYLHTLYRYEHKAYHFFSSVSWKNIFIACTSKKNRALEAEDERVDTSLNWNCRGKNIDAFHRNERCCLKETDSHRVGKSSRQSILGAQVC